MSSSFPSHNCFSYFYNYNPYVYLFHLELCQWVIEICVHLFYLFCILWLFRGDTFTAPTYSSTHSTTFVIVCDKLRPTFSNIPSSNVSICLWWSPYTTTDSSYFQIFFIIFKENLWWSFLCLLRFDLHQKSCLLNFQNLFLQVMAFSFLEISQLAFTP